MKKNKETISTQNTVPLETVIKSQKTKRSKINLKNLNFKFKKKNRFLIGLT